MLYLLLIIIAVGVLLISETGKKILGWLFILALICGGLYLGFWIIVLGIGLFSNKELKDNILPVFGTILIIGYVGYFIFDLSKKIKRKEITINSVKNHIKKEVKEIWAELLKHKISLTFLCLAILFIIYLSIFGL